MNKNELIDALVGMGVELSGNETKAELQETYDKLQITDAHPVIEQVPTTPEVKQPKKEDNKSTEVKLTPNQIRNMSHQALKK